MISSDMILSLSIITRSDIIVLDPNYSVLLFTLISYNNSTIEQLIFKEYWTSENIIGKNNRYKQQLWVNLKCENITLKGIENLDYEKRDLIMLFIKYNNCNNLEYVNFENKAKKGSFNLALRVGFNSSSLSIKNARSNFFDADFDTQLGVRLGIEAEFIMPFNKNKWGLIIEPTYQFYKAENNLSTVDYTSIELPIGIRHYFFLNDNSKIFVNGSFIADFANGTIAGLEIKSGVNFAFGIGYKNNDKYILELRYHTKRDLFRNYQFWSSNYNTISVILGYSLF